jgi:nitroreductase
MKMEIFEAVKTRKTIRCFKPDPVPMEILKNILETALQAPSWANTQPWELIVVGGSKFETIKKIFLEKSGAEAAMDVPRPQEFPEPFLSRIQALVKKESETLGIKREDEEARVRWRLQNTNSYGAPCMIYILVDRAFYYQKKGVNAWSVFDCGLMAENIMLLAAACGLGTVAQAQAVAYPDILRKVLGVPDSKLFLLGIAIGYPNWDEKIAHFRPEKKSLSQAATWIGFD